MPKFPRAVQQGLRTTPAAVVTAVNRQLHACSPVDRYATLFFISRSKLLIGLPQIGITIILPTEPVRLPAQSCCPKTRMTIALARDFQIRSGSLRIHLR